MSKDNTNVPREGYLTNLRTRLAEDLAAVQEDPDLTEGFIDWVVTEIYDSYKRGQKAGPTRKKAYPKKGKPDQS